MTPEDLADLEAALASITPDDVPGALRRAALWAATYEERAAILRHARELEKRTDRGRKDKPQ